MYPDRSAMSQPDHPRRTFAIISHPDAGKTTMTEKLLLLGGAIQMAGTVKARKASKHAKPRVALSQSVRPSQA